MACGHRPTAGYLRDGRVMVTYRFIPCGNNNIFASVMKKEDLLATELKEQAVRTLPLDYDRHPVPDLGYTGWVQFADGEIYLVNYIKDDADKAYIRGCRFAEEDIMLPTNS
jgi:sialidase-1